MALTWIKPPASLDGQELMAGGGRRAMRHAARDAPDL